MLQEGIIPEANKRTMQANSALAQNRGLNAQELGEIHDLFYATVYRYVSYRLEDVQLCEDIASEVFLRLVEALEARKEIKEMRGWLLGTASHLVADHLRRKYRRRTESLDDHHHLADGRSPEGQAEQNLRQAMVREAMRRLTEDQQNVLALRFSQELSLEETAQILGKSVGAVKVLQFRALEALRRYLEVREADGQVGSLRNF